MHTEVCPGIDWVGYVDWNVRDFHGYETRRGATYNSYLIRDEKNVLIDTVKSHFASQLMENVEELISLPDISYVICNHAEPDHSGSLPYIMTGLPHAQLVCNARCRETLSAYYDTSTWNFLIVDNGDTLKIGNRTLQFFNTPMVHWPESMMTYCENDKILFSMDAFGQHLASSERFNDQMPISTIMQEARTYYANIVCPYGRQVMQTLETFTGMDVQILATSHGIIWRKDLKTILDMYHDWGAGVTIPKVLILYDSMWESTTRMAKVIYEGVLDVHDVSAQIMNVRRCSLTEIATAALDTPCCAMGSATLNTLQMPALAAVMNYLQGLRPPIHHCAAFGSYGWGRGAVERITEWFGEIGWKSVHEPVKCKFRPDDETLTKCHLVGRLLAEKALENG